MRLQVPSLAWLSGLRIWLRPHIAVTPVGICHSVSLNPPPKKKVRNFEIEFGGSTERTKGLSVNGMYIIRIDQTMHTQGQGQKEGFYFVIYSSLEKLGLWSSHLAPQCNVF